MRASNVIENPYKAPSGEDPKVSATLLRYRRVTIAGIVITAIGAVPFALWLASVPPVAPLADVLLPERLLVLSPYVREGLLQTTSVLVMVGVSLVFAGLRSASDHRILQMRK
jgi:hypothetical protein